MALPNPIPDNPLRWDAWRNYNSPSLYERLCLDHTGNYNPDVIEENTRQLLVWWQKKLPLKNQPSNPMAQLLRQGLDEAPQYLAEARTRLLDPEQRAEHDAELHAQLVTKAIGEFKKLLAFTLAEKRLTEDSEIRLTTAGEGMGLRKEDMLPVIEEELQQTGSTRVLSVAVASPTPPVRDLPLPAAAKRMFSPPPAEASERDPATEFRKILQMSRLCLDGEEMSDDQRDAMCNLGESLGLSGADSEDLIDQYLEEMASMPMSAEVPTPSVRSSASVATSTRSAPAAPVLGRPVVAAPVKPTINLSPVARADEKIKYANFVNSAGLDMYLIPTGQFRMGCETEDAQSNETPITPVIVSCFYMSRYTVTNGMYEKFDASHRSKRAAWADENHPVIYVSAIEADAYCKWLSQREGRKYRLPSEAEWEYAARGGETRMFPWGDSTVIAQLANFADVRTQFAWRDPSVDDGYAETAPIASFPRGASSFGMEDMAGNVFEWCLDAFEPYKGKECINPKVQKLSSNRVYRGGSWKSRISSLRCCSRNSNMPGYQSNDVGFRIVCDCE